MPGEVTLLFDGDCGFCTFVINKVKRWLKPRAQIVQWQAADLDDLGVTESECAESIQFVAEDGTHVSEGQAVAQVLKVSRQPWPVLGSIVDLPLVINVANATYRLIARNRYRLPGSTPACQLEVPPAVEGGSKS